MFVFDKRAQAEYYETLAMMHATNQSDDTQDMVDKYKKHKFPHHEQVQADQMEQAAKKLEEEVDKAFKVEVAERGMPNAGS